MSTPSVDAYIAALPTALNDIATELRDLLNREVGTGFETVWHGHPVWKNGKNPVAGFKAYSSHLTFMMWKATNVTDLDAGPNGMANIKLRAAQDLDVPMFSKWLSQLDTP